MTFSLKTTLVSASLALGVLTGSLAPASADVGVWFGPNVGIGFGGHGVGVGIGVGVGVGVGHGHYGTHHAYAGHCSKGDALGRAASMGVKKRWVSGVSGHRISVKGMHKGQPVKVTMYRNTENCAVRSFDYL
jgi:hypothetical protein